MGTESNEQGSRETSVPPKPRHAPAFDLRNQTPAEALESAKRNTQIIAGITRTVNCFIESHGAEQTFDGLLYVVALKLFKQPGGAFQDTIDKIMAATVACKFTAKGGRDVEQMLFDQIERDNA